MSKNNLKDTTNLLPEVQVLKGDADEKFVSDGWANILSQVSKYRVKRAKDLGSGGYFNRLGFSECSHLFASDGIAKKIVTLPVKYAFLNGWRFQVDDWEKEETLKWEEDLSKELKGKYDLVNQVLEAIIWGRVYGSAFLLLNVNDGRHFIEPLDINNIKEIKWIKAFSPLRILPLRRSYESMTRYLEPEFYTFIGYGGEEMTGRQIHHSRIIRFNGQKLTRDLYLANNYMHNSVLQPAYDPLQDYNLALESCGLGIAEYSIGVYKIKNLAQQMASGNEAKVIQRLQSIDMAKSNSNSVMMDADNETYERTPGRFSGMDDLISKFEKKLVAISEIPHNLLFSEAAGHSGSVFGSNKGESEWSEWETTVDSFRKQYVTDNLERLYKIVFADKSLSVRKPKPDSFNIVFSSQRKLNETQEAEVYKSISETDIQQIESGILTPEEIRTTRYGPGGTFSDYDIRVELDETAFKKSQELKEKQAAMAMQQNPEGEEGEDKDDKAKDEDKKPTTEKVKEKVKNGIKFILRK